VVAAEAELDDEAYDANMQRKFSVDDYLPEQPEQEAAAPPAAAGSGTEAPAAPAEPTGGEHTASPTQPNGHAAGQATAADIYRYEGTLPLTICIPYECDVHPLSSLVMLKPSSALILRPRTHAAPPLPSSAVSSGRAESSGRSVVQRNYSIARSLGGREAPGAASFSGLQRLGSKLRMGSSSFTQSRGSFGSRGGSFTLARCGGAVSMSGTDILSPQWS
jgi:hypothetical protein